jgi:hypothetical protein
LAVFWVRLIEFVQANIQWFWERTHHFVVDSATSLARKQRNSHMRQPRDALLREVVDLIRAGTADVDILLVPALLRCTYPPLPVFPPVVEVNVIERFVSQLDDRWPERTYSLADTDHHIATHPTVDGRIICKLDQSSSQ